LHLINKIQLKVSCIGLSLNTPIEIYTGWRRDIVIYIPFMIFPGQPVDKRFQLNIMSHHLPHIEYEQMTDEELVRSSLQYEDAFYSLIKRYEPVLLQYIHRITKVSLEEAEDLLQDIFIKVYRNLNGFDTDLKFSTWVYRIAHNEIISKFRKKRPYLFSVELDADDEGARSLAGFMTDTLNVESKYLDREKAKMVRTALGELSPKYRDILVLHYFEDLSYREISDILQKPPGSVATLINRAKEKFKKIAEHHQLESV
jgi:RNA polymerase sigma-70 factor (ECF subfamily)